MGTVRLIQAYYLGSPLFFLFGVWWGVELRASFLPSPGLRSLYYAFVTALGVLTYFRPRTAPFVAMGESCVNLLLIFLWILLPIYGLGDTALEGGGAGVPYTPGEVLVNGGLAGLVFVLGFYRAQRAALATKT